MLKYSYVFKLETMHVKIQFTGFLFQRCWFLVKPPDVQVVPGDLDVRGLNVYRGSGFPAPGILYKTVAGHAPSDRELLTANN